VVSFLIKSYQIAENNPPLVMILNKLTSNTFVSLLIRENLIPYATKCKEVIEQCSRNSILCTRNNRYGTAQEKLSYKMKFLFCLLFG